MMPTFHPAYLLRNEGAKREVWEDMKQVVAELEKRTGRKLEVATGKRGGP
jgi:uracil-DNA glycosylase